MLNESKRILIIMLIAISAKVLGFVREIAMASVFGATSYTDAYLIATTIPLVVFASMGESLSTTFIPMYSYITEKRSKDEALNFMNNVLHLLMLVTTSLSILGVLFSKSLVSIFAMGFKGETLELAVSFTNILLPGIILIGINYVFTGFLQANKNFYVTAFIAFPKNIVIILSTVLSYFWNKSILAYGTLLGIASQLVYQLYFALKGGYTYKFQRKLIDSDIKNLGYLIIPVFLGMTVQQLNVLIDKTLASTLSEGSIAALNFADKLNSFVFGIFTAPLVMVVYTIISQLAAKEDWKAFYDTIQKSISFMLLLLIPVSIGAMCLSTPVVKALFQRGYFDERATHNTAIALFYYSIGMTASGFRIILSKAFYSLQDTKTPMFNGIIAIIVNIFLNFILIKPLGHGGLALATSISSIIGAILLFNNLKSRMKCFEERKVLVLIIKAGISSLFMAIGLKISYILFSQAFGSGFLNEIMLLFTCILLGGLIYLFSIVLIRVEEARVLITYLKNKTGAMYFLNNKLDTLKRYIWRIKALHKNIAYPKQLKLLLGVSSPTEDEASKVVYHLISSLPAEKYDITLIAAGGSAIADKAKKYNENSSSKVNIVVIPSFERGISALSNLKTFFIILKTIYVGKFHIVHFHSFRLGVLGCIAAWLLKVPKILFTVHGWYINESSAYTFFQRLLARIATNIICVSKFDLNKGINKKWINIKNASIIYYGIEKSVFRTPALRRELKISKKIPIIGMLAELDDFDSMAYIMDIFNELKQRESRFKLIIMVSRSQVYKCEMRINELGLSSYVNIICHCRDKPIMINDFDIFSYFSNKEKVPIEVIEAMFAQKPIIANGIGALSELVEEGRNGYIIKEQDVNTAVKNIEKLLKSNHLRKVMGNNGKSMAFRKFSKEKMISEYELLMKI